MYEHTKPIRFFILRDIDKHRGGDGGKRRSAHFPELLSARDLTDRAAKLSAECEALERAVGSHQQKTQQIPFVFIAKLRSEILTTKQHREVVDFLHIEKRNTVIGRTFADVLLVRVDTQAEMQMITLKAKEFLKYDTAISCLTEFALFEPRVVVKKGTTHYKIKLVDYQDANVNMEVQRQFEKTLNKKKIVFKRTYYTDNLLIYHVQNADGETIIDVLKRCASFAAIHSIEPMPGYKMKLDVYDIPRQVPVVCPEGSRKDVTVGVLDSGIAAIPHLAPWLTDRKWQVYPDSLINPAHGTFVAGILIYGDANENQDLVGYRGAGLFDANIFPDTARQSIYEDELMENIRKAVEENHKQIKIWNLSISIRRPADDSAFSDFAVTIDALQEKYAILICKSAGNCSNFLSGKPKGRVYAGADSVHSLVVGSIAQEKNRYDLAEVDAPSPFTRVGPGPAGVIKPEVVHYGGNVGVDEEGKLTVTGVKSFSPKGNLTTSVGTSFAAARVTALAAGLAHTFQNNQECDPLLLKTLIIHSAVYVKNEKFLETERLNQVGFGRPKALKEIIANTPYEVTLIFRDRLARGERIEIVDFPMPDCLVHDGFYTGQIVATLVHKPILEATQGAEYCQSSLDLQLGSFSEKISTVGTNRKWRSMLDRKEAKNLLQPSLYSRRKMDVGRDRFAWRERLLPPYGDTYYPVKKYGVDLSELTETNQLRYLSSDRRWFLSLRSLFREHVKRKAERDLTELNLEFCLAVTIRDPRGKASVYDAVAQKLDKRTANAKTFANPDDTETQYTYDATVSESASTQTTWSQRRTDD